MFVSPLERAISWLTPPECIICKTENYMLCYDCRPQYIFQTESRCYLCNKLTKSYCVCSSCRSRSALRRVWWLAEYESFIKELIFGMKYLRKRSYAREFGELLADHAPYFNQPTLIVPLPTASRRVRQRSYDQAVLLAQSFAQARRLPLRQVLRRKNQADQIGLSRQARFKQMEKAFGIRDVSLKGRSVLLVDDVLTTGASLESAARLLRKHGAKHVDAAVVARHLLK